MKLDIHAHGYGLTRSAYRHIRRRLGALSARHGQLIQRVSVSLTQGNGLNGSGNRGCMLELQLAGVPGGSQLVAHGSNPDLFAAVDKAFVRATYALRRLETQRRRRIQPYRSAA